MRLAQVEIGGKSYPAAFTLRVLANLEERAPGKSAIDALDDMLAAGCVSDTVWLLAQLLAAGAEVTGSGAAAPTERELLDGLGIDDLHAVTAAVLRSVHTVEPEIRLKKKTPLLRIFRAGKAPG